MATEKRLIDANKLVRKINKLAVFCFTGETDIQICDCQMVELGAVLAEIDEAVTMDAVEVVRCKDCRKEGLEECPMVQRDHVTGNLYAESNSMDYCSRGERRTDT